MPTSRATIEKQVSEALSLNSETNTVEFKDARGGLPGDLWRPITAFANTPPGGCIVFGVQERQEAQGRSLTAVGGLDLASIQEKIVSLLEHKIVNHSDYDLYLLNIDDVTLLVLHIGEIDKENKPCYNVELGMHKGACIRVGNVNRLISEEELRAILRYTPAYNYDKTLLVSVSERDLDQLKIAEYLTKSAVRRQRQFDKRTSTGKVLINIGLCALDADGQVRPTLAGGLLFLKKYPSYMSNYHDMSFVVSGFQADRLRLRS